jgi:hypothetical protein
MGESFPVKDVSQVHLVDIFVVVVAFNFKKCVLEQNSTMLFLE